MSHLPSQHGRLSVVVVDDSPVQRRFLRASIEADGEFTVLGEAGNGREAVAMVQRFTPAVVLMDLDLPVMSGLEAIRLIMAGAPTPILVYSAFTAGAHDDTALEALAAGAVDVLAKPATDDTAALEEYAAVLRRKLRVAARVRVVTSLGDRLRSTDARLPAPASTTRTPVAPTPTAPAPALRRPLAPASAPRQATRTGQVRLVAVGASTGGPQALLTLLGQLPPDLTQAVLVVQHMADGFIPGLASWLDDLVPMPVVVGESGSRLLPGTITIAPSGGNLLLQDSRLRVLCTPPEPGQFHVPGIDAAFGSVARVLGREAVGVILTGMGRDGAAGLLAMRECGAQTLGQDEATCAVYGMPAAARALGAVQRQLPLAEIAPALLTALGRTHA